jgi:hypothetical protein
MSTLGMGNELSLDHKHWWDFRPIVLGHNMAETELHDISSVGKEG